AVTGDDLDDLLEDVALEALGLEDLADLLALAFGVAVDFDFFGAAGPLGLLGLSAGAEEVGGGHGEAVGDEVGDTHDQYDGGAEAGAGGGADDGEGGDRAVDAAVDEV